MPSKELAFQDAVVAFGIGNVPDLSMFTALNRALFAEQQIGALTNPTATLARLREGVEAQKRARLSRIHSSWLIRALQDEPRSVRVSVVAQLPESHRSEVADGLTIAPEEIAQVGSNGSSFGSHALIMAMSKLVGDVETEGNDSPAIKILTSLDPSAAPKMIRRIGILKWSTTSFVYPVQEVDEFERLDSWIDSLGRWDIRFLDACEANVLRLNPNDPKALTRLGLWTFSRLLTLVDPHRVRWTLQQLPYPTAKTLRNRMGDSEPDFPVLVAEEARLLKEVWTSLFNERAVESPWPEEASP